MGLFDKNKFKYNDADMNINKDDGIDTIYCQNETCMNRDSRGYCLYEACIKEVNIPHHKFFIHKCELCNKEYEVDTSITPPGSSLIYFMCNECINKLKGSV